MKSIGILGGGQLAQFLSLNSKALNLKVKVLSASKKDPAAYNISVWTKGDPQSLTDLKKFLTDKDILSFESEFFSAQHIKKALRSKTQAIVAPSLKNLKNIQDRLYQKKLLQKYNLLTAEFTPVKFKNQKNLQKKLLACWNKWGAFVLKSRMGGYDGYGTFIIKKKSQITKLKLPKTNFIAEKFIPFERELAILSARNKKGQVIFFPLVESFQKKSICLWVKGPILHKKLKNLKTQIKKFLNYIDYQGVIAFELFDIHSNLVVNELAPRVHNTGHYSLDALTENQFKIHLKAISNQNLKAPRLKMKAFAMFNLLGEGFKKPLFKQKSLLDKSLEKELKKQNISLYWYGKAESRKGRKMGHLNSIAPSSQQALNKLLKLRPFLKV